MITRKYKYKNGNYDVSIFDDGSKIRIIPDGETPKPVFPECIDIKLTNKCPFACPYCHENSTSEGTQLNFSLDTLMELASSFQPGIEVALGGGALTTLMQPSVFSTIPQLFMVINVFREIGRAVVNVTLNQKELGPVADEIAAWINGAAGVSFREREDPVFERFISENKNSVVHVINGLTTKEDFEYLKKLNCKILILGYKDFRRGNGYLELMFDYIEKNMKDTADNILDYMSSFRSVSFDTLALEQLNIKDKVPKDVWNMCYLGDDGEYTMYLDLVEMKYAKNSTQPEDSRYPVPKSRNIKEMFLNLRKEQNAQ